jgi:hypothetical protein
MPALRLFVSMSHNMYVSVLNEPGAYTFAEDIVPAMGAQSYLRLPADTEFSTVGKGQSPVTPLSQMMSDALYVVVFVQRKPSDMQSSYAPSSACRVRWSCSLGANSPHQVTPS